MKNNRLWQWALILTTGMTCISVAHGVSLKGMVEKAIWDGFKYYVFGDNPNFTAVGTASAGAVVMDTSASHQKGWYGESLMYDHQTTINGWQSAPISTYLDQATTDHRYYPANFQYYDMVIYNRDPNDPSKFISNNKWVGSSWFEPDIYIDHSMTYVIWATTKRSETKFRVFSRFTMQNGPDDRLRNDPGKYEVEVRHTVYQLQYTTQQGMVRIPDHKVKTSFAFLNKIADDNAQIDLLKDQQWMMQGPNAYGWIRRKWEKQTEATVHSSMIEPVPVGVPVGGAPVTIREIYRIKEEMGKEKQ